MPATPATRYAAIYVRMSTEDQGKGFSIPTQIETCQKLAEHEGYTVPESHVLVDEGISGTTMDRPGLRTLRDLVHTQAIVAAIVYDPDRLSRHEKSGFPSPCRSSSPARCLTRPRPSSRDRSSTPVAIGKPSIC